MTLFGSNGSKAEPAKLRGRKLRKRPNQKKQPQRGLGVARLERLRLQEQFQYQITLLSFSDHTGKVPLQHVPTSWYCRPAVVSSCDGCGLFGFEKAGLVAQSVANPCDLHGTGRGVYTDPRLRFGSIESGTSIGLSSIPNMRSVSHDHDHSCGICPKKKRLNMSNPRYNEGTKDKITEMFQANRSDILGLNLQNIQNSEVESGGFVSATTCSCTSGCNSNKAAEEREIHRKGRSRGYSFTMEYEFFPRKNDKTTTFEEQEFPSEASGSVGEEGSSISDTTCGKCNSNTIDLSLRLSF